MVGGKGARFNVNIDELRQFNPRLANFVVKSPIDAIKMFENQLNGTIKGMNDVDGGKGGLNNEKTSNASDMYFPRKVQVYYINFEGNFG